MDYVTRDKEITLRSMPEDVKRHLMREIEKCKGNSPFVHYQFAHHLLTKYESVMDIFVTSESSASEIEELKEAHAFCLKAVNDDNNLIWICKDCKKVIGVFKNTIPGIEVGEFTKYLLSMIKNCPSCGGSNYVLMKSGFLLSGLTLEQSMGNPPLEGEREDRTTQLLWMTIRGTNRDLKTSVKTMAAISGENALKDMIKEGKIQNFSQKDDDGNYWNVFGKMTPEDMKRFGLSQNSDKPDLKKMVKDGSDYIDKNCFEEANQCFDKVLEYGSNGAVWGLKGLALDGLNKNEDALICFDKFLETDPENVFILEKKVNILYGKLSKYEEAVEWLTKILSTNDKKACARAYYNKAVILRNHLHRHEEAIECFKKAADLGNPDAKDALKQLGLL